MENLFENEQQIENRLRKHRWLIPVVTLFAAALLYAGMCWCLFGYRAGYHFVVIPAGILAHAFLIITVHDGAHKGITRGKFDYVIMNLGAALMLIPFYGEPFRKYHLTHHANTNTDVDPLWPGFKKEMYAERRWLYILCECVPLMFTLVLVLSGKKGKDGKAAVAVKQPSIRVPYMAASIMISAVLIFFFRPPLGFVLGTLFVLNLMSVLRHWCEHMGTDTGKESNTFWFPLGMGIGNHEAHHQYPHFSWLTMMLGLFSRERDTDPVKSLIGLFTDKRHVHYGE